MATKRETLEQLLDRLTPRADVSFRAMMGEYVLYCGGKVVGGLYDGRLLVKPVAAACAMLPEAPLELPYDGAKPMLRVPFELPGETLAALFTAVADALPEPKKRRK